MVLGAWRDAKGVRGRAIAAVASKSRERMVGSMLVQEMGGIVMVRSQ